MQKYLTKYDKKTLKKSKQKNNLLNLIKLSIQDYFNGI